MDAFAGGLAVAGAISRMPGGDPREHEERSD